MQNTLSKYDKSNLRKVILSTSKQFEEGLLFAKDVKIPKKFNNVMISGMGGSALPGDILRIYQQDLLTRNKNYARIGFYQNRSYDLPIEAYDNCLNIICSHSGNTEETISSFNQALDNNLPCVGISAGGKIAEMCKEYDIPHVKLTVPFENFQPRMATGHFLSAILQLLVYAEKIPDVVEDLSSTSLKLGELIPTLETQGQELAKKLVGKTPVIYSSVQFKPLSLIWKIKLNENSKIPAFWNVFPELNHNEFVGFTNPQADYAIIMLRNTTGNKQVLKRYAITADLLTAKGIDVHTIDIPTGSNILYRLFASLALCDWTSYYLALEYGIDPTPVDMVENLKKALTE